MVNTCLGIDYGLKRTGLALSDELGMIAGALDTVSTHDLMPTVKKLVVEKSIATVVVGQPKRWSGDFSDIEGHIAGFVKRLKQAHPELNVVRQDERFTSKIAQATILQSGVRKSKRQEKGLVDKVSAALILQAYLDTL